MSKRVELDKSKGDIITCHCNKCNNKTNHEIIHNIRVDDDENIDGSFYISWYDDYQIIMCRGCDTISFRHISWFSEDDAPYWDGTRYYHYPERKRKEPLYIDPLPIEVRKLYHEVISAYNVGAFTLVAGGLRALIEAICKVKNIKNGKAPFNAGGELKYKTKDNLEGKIYGLSESGYISQKQIVFGMEHKSKILKKYRERNF